MTDELQTNEDRIIKIDIEQEMRTAYIDYSMSVIVSRALPDVRDGLKPVHRRVLYGMNEMGNTSNHAHKKAANAVGEVMGRYHPHGDSSIYGTIVRLAQPWAMRYTLIDGHGNFGSIDNDPPAAMRYTEVRLQRITDEMLEDIDSETVDFQPNYDNSREEPTVLPTRFPNLLVNGASGIAVGMATNMPPHNLTEAIDASIAVLRNPDITIDELIEIIPAPDFPTGGLIYGYNGVRQAFETGRGRIIVRATTEIEKEKDHENIVITEIPYNVVKSDLVESIATLVTEKKIDGIADIKDLSNYIGLRIIIKLKSDANANVVLNKLFKMTQLQSSFSVNNVALVNGRPKTLNLKELLQSFVDHRKDVVLRRTKYELRKARERAHILEGLIIASQNIDEVIAIIRASASTEDARTRLSERFGLTPQQTAAIVEMRLKQLTGLEQNKLRQEYDDLLKEIERLQLILDDESVCHKVIEDELIEVKNNYGDPRKTRIDRMAGDFNAEDFYSDDEMIITISHMGYIKRTPLTEFRAQNRGGLGSRGSNTRDEDFIEYIYPASMHQNLLFFTRKGLHYRLKVYEIPEGTKTSKGRNIQNILNIEPDDAITSVIKVRDIKDPNLNLVFATRKGIVKRTALVNYSSSIAAKGVKSMAIEDDDQLIGVKLTDGTYDIMMANRNGRANRFPERQLRLSGRTSGGVRGMKLDNDDDRIVGLVAVPADSDVSVLVLSENGFGKRSLISDYRLTARGGKGVRTMKVTEKTGKVVALEVVTDDNDLVIINKSGITLRIRCADLRIMGRATQGVRIINLEKRCDEIASVCCVDTDPEEETEVIDIDSNEVSEELDNEDFVENDEEDFENVDIDDELDSDEEIPYSENE